MIVLLNINNIHSTQHCKLILLEKYNTQLSNSIEQITENKKRKRENWNILVRKRRPMKNKIVIKKTKNKKQKKGTRKKHS